MRPLGLLLMLAVPLQAATFTVTTTSPNGPGSLLAAVSDANANPGPDRIEFNIPGAGPHLIDQPAGEYLPIVSETVVIDGSTQPGYAGVPLIHFTQRGSAALQIAASNSVLRGISFSGTDFTRIVNIEGDANLVEECAFPTGYRGTLKIDGNHNVVRRNQMTAEPDGAGRFLFVSGENNEIGPGNVTHLFLYNARSTHVFGNQLGYVAVNVDAHDNLIEQNDIDRLSHTWTHAASGWGSGNAFVGNRYPSLESVELYDAANDAGDADVGEMNNLQNVPLLTHASLGATSATVHVELDSSATATRSLLLEFHKGRYTPHTSPRYPDATHVYSECVAGNTINRLFAIPAAALTAGEYLAAMATSYRDETCTQPLDGSSEFGPPVLINDACEPVTTVSTSGDVTVRPGESVELTVEANGEGTSYIWYLDSDSGFARIEGATSPTLIVVPTKTTKYRVEVSNRCSSLLSDVITVNVCVPPAFTLRAERLAVVAGERADFEVLVSNPSTSIVWRDSLGREIARDTPTLTLHPYESIEVSVTVSNDCGSETQSVATHVCRRISAALKKSHLGVTANGPLAELSVEESNDLKLIEWYEQTRTGRKLLASGVPMLVVSTRKAATYIVRMASRCEEVERSISIGSRSRPIARP